MSKRKRRFIVAAITGVFMVGAVAVASEEAGSGSAAPSFDLGEISCSDAMAIAEDERNALLFFLYGYVAGGKQQVSHDRDGIQAQLRSAGEYCVEHPSAKVLEAMKKANESIMAPGSETSSADCPVLASRKWRAWIEQGGDGRSGLRLQVAGEIETPTPGYVFTMEPGPLDRRRPPSLRVRILGEAPEGSTIQVIDVAEVSFSIETRVSEYRSIIVLCGDEQLAEIEDVELAE